MITYEQIKEHLLKEGWKVYKNFCHPKYQYPEYFCYTPEKAYDCCVNNKKPLYWLRLNNFRLAYSSSLNIISGEVEISGELPSGLWLRSSTTVDDADLLDTKKMDDVESFLVAAWNSAWITSDCQKKRGEE